MNLPNWITLSRIFFVPLLVVVLLTPVSERVGAPRYLLGVLLLAIAALTDLFDGKLARRRNQVTDLGKLLDTLADKLLISSALIVLVEIHVAPAWAVVILVGREFIITGLRSAAATQGIVIGAALSGKIKMWAQVFTVGFLILSLSPIGGPPHIENFGQPFPHIQFWTVPELRLALDHLVEMTATWNDAQILFYAVGRGLLWVTVILSIFSMVGYIRAFKFWQKKA